MTMPGDDRFEREVRSVIRASAPDAAPPDLRDRVGASLAVQPVRRTARWVPWEFVAALSAAIVLVAVLLRPQPADLQGGPRQSGAASQPVAAASAAPTAWSTPNDALTEYPGEVQTGQLLTPTDGVVMNTAGRILITRTAGATWRDITPGDPGQADIERPYFLDAAHGWVVTYTEQLGEPGVRVWRTTDGGTTWAGELLAGVRAVDWKLQFLSPTVGLLATDPSGESPKPELRSTDDGGATWSDPIDLAAASGVPQLHDIAFFDREHAVMTGGETLLFTTDGGLTWAAPRVSNTDFEIVSGQPVYHSARVVDASTAFVVIDWRDDKGVTHGQTIIETFDAGANWVARYGDARHRYWDFVDSTHWIAIDGTTTWTTEDGGSAWGSASSTGLPVELDVAAPQFVDPLHGWAVASGGPPCTFSCTARLFELFKTSDGGGSWSLVGACDPSSDLAFACPTALPGSS